ncbi:hypothetical protein ACFLRC_05105 [Candidatus Altiarchaeota archaeon]
MLSEHKREITETISGVCPPPEEEKEVVLLKVRFIKPTPSFLGVDMQEYGPYAVDDTPDIPEENARILIDKEVVEET